MRRADRLFRIVQLLRRRELTTAARLAERLEVSERTIYRDVADLVRSGVPIEGEAGVGYQLGRGFDLPPMMFDRTELQALVLGARMVATWGDEELRDAAKGLLEKTEAVLPPRDRPRMRETALFALRGFYATDAKFMGELRRGIDSLHKVALVYRDEQGRETQRVIRPLALFHWGNTWTAAAWCDLREGYRHFRLDRIQSAKVLSERFVLESPVTLEDFERDRSTW